MKRIPTSKQDLKPLSDYRETEDCFVSGIYFDPSEDDRIFEGCPPFLVLSSNTDENEFYEIPKEIAYYAKQHRGWTKKGRKTIEDNAIRRFKIELRDLLRVEQ